MTNDQLAKYNIGWQKNKKGDLIQWKCPKCKTIIGKNLNGDLPFYHASEHIVKCYPEGE